MTDAEALELLGQPAPPALPRESKTCPVADFIDLNGLMPGRAPAVELNVLYRMYLGENDNPVKPLLFARKVHALGFKTGKTMTSRPLKMNGESARRMRRWLELNPQPFGWAKQFQSHFWARGGK